MQRMTEADPWEALQRYLLQFGPLPAAEWQALASQMTRKTFARGAFFLREGAVNRRIGWVFKGLFRYGHTTSQGRERTKYFVGENQFVSALESFEKQLPAEEFVEALTPAEVLVMGYEAFQWLRHHHPFWQERYHQISLQAYQFKIGLINNLLEQDAATRYAEFAAQQPQVLLQAPLHHVASYLRMTPQSLSRLRRERSRRQG